MDKKRKGYIFKLLSQIVVLHLVLFCINLWLFLRIGLQTMIPTIGLVELYVLLCLLFSIITREEKLKYKGLIGFSLVPLLINILLCINYVFSFNPVTEIHAVHWNYEQAGRRKEFRRPGLITLSDNAYNAYPGIRIFSDYERIARFNKVNYTFKTGLFGIRVMTDYEFIF